MLTDARFAKRFSSPKAEIDASTNFMTLPKYLKQIDDAYGINPTLDNPFKTKGSRSSEM